MVVFCVHYLCDRVEDVLLIKHGNLVMYTVSNLLPSVPCIVCLPELCEGGEEVLLNEMVKDN